jgi:hypothetical protein
MAAGRRLFSDSDRDRLVAWIHCMPSGEQVTATLVSGFAPEAAAKVRLEVQGGPRSRSRPAADLRKWLRVAAAA